MSDRKHNAADFQTGEDSTNLAHRKHIQPTKEIAISLDRVRNYTVAFVLMISYTVIIYRHSYYAISH